MADLAKLQIAVDTTQVRTAIKDLENLQAATKRFSDGTAGAAQKSTSALNTITGGTSGAAKAVNDNMQRAALSMTNFSAATSSALNSAQKSFTGVSTAAAATSSNVSGVFGRMVNSVSSGLSGLSTRLGDTLSPLNRLTGAFRAVNEAALSVFLVFQGFKILGGVLGSFVAAGDSMQKTKIRLETLTGSAKEANETYGYLFKTAQKMSIPFDDLSRSYSKLLPLINNGVLTTKQGRDILEGLADTAAATGATTEQLNQSMYGLAQALTSPKVQAQELNQIIEPLPGLLQNLDAAAALPAGGFRKLVNEGKITSQILAETLPAALARYKGSAEAQRDLVSASATRLSNEWTKLKATLSIPLNFVYANFLQGITFLIRQVNALIDAIKSLTSITDTASGGKVGDISQKTKDQLNKDYAALSGGKKETAGKASFNYGEYIKNLNQEISILKMESRTADVVTESYRAYNDAKKDGITLSGAQGTEIFNLIRQKQLITEVKDITKAANDDLLNADAEKLKSLTEVEAAQRNLLRSNEADRLTQLLPIASELEKSGQLIGAYDAIQKKIVALRSIEITNPNDEITTSGLLSSAELRLKELAQTDAKGAGTAIADAMTNAFNAADDALVNFVKSGKLNFGDLADSIISDLARIAIQQSITKPLAGAFGSLLGVAGTALGSYFGGGGAAAASSGAVAQGSTVGSYTVGGGGFTGASSLPGFATGGSFTVGGAGGTDSQVVSFRATPGEMVNIQTPQGGGANSPAINQSFTIDARGADPASIARLDKAIDSLSRTMKTQTISAVREAKSRGQL
jgi:tape measure domain-containing protein